MTSSGPAKKPAARRSSSSRASTSVPPDDVEELRQQVAQTREQLGETVEQLAAKADVKARAQGKAAELAGRVKGQAIQARAQAAARAGTVRDQLAGNAADVRRSAVDLGTSAKDQVSARVTPAWEATPEPARQAVAKGASTARQHRVPLAAAAGALIVGLLILRWWRKR
jgi:methylphosphotriester-DNA--protein-cysteine methyltransferase